MLELTIDGQSVTVPDGSTVLEAARALGLFIPTLCHLAGVKEHRPSCLACVVRIGDDPRVVPACSTRVAAGMVVHSETPDVLALRKAALEMLFSDHLGDCVSICQRVCPARLPIPALIRRVADGQLPAAAALALDASPFPATLGYICRAPCQQGCRRRQHDGAVAIQSIERAVGESNLTAAAPHLPARPPASGRRVAIVGAGAAGLSAAYFLLRAGHACTVFDDQAEPGGALRRDHPESQLPRAVLEGEIALIQRLGVELRLQTRIGRDLRLADLCPPFDAVILAVGDLQKTDASALGVAASPRSIRIQAGTFLTSAPGVFACGSAIRAGYDPARSAGDGAAVARIVNDFLAGRPRAGAAPPVLLHHPAPDRTRAGGDHAGLRRGPARERAGRGRRRGRGAAAGSATAGPRRIAACGATASGSGWKPPPSPADTAAASSSSASPRACSSSPGSASPAASASSWPPGRRSRWAWSSSAAGLT
jgi:ferredoxin